jgi:hypothetical protein
MPRKSPIPIEEQLRKANEEIERLRKLKTPKQNRPKREPTEHQKFMGRAIKDIRAQHRKQFPGAPDMPVTQAMSIAAEMWNKQKQRP